MREINSVVILASVSNVQCPVLQLEWKPICAFLLELAKTSSQVLFVGQHRVVKLLRLQTHPNEVLPVAVWLSLKKGVKGIERYKDLTWW